MKTDDLIEALAAGVRPVRPARPSPILLAGAALAAVAAVVLLLGLRSDLMLALQGPAPWLKALYTAVLAAAALRLAIRLGRPGADARPAAVGVLVIISLAAVLGGVELAFAPSGERLSDWLGRTWTICGRNILIVAAGAAPLVFVSARSLAPTRPMFAGAALGIATGGIAATAYGLLHCPESTVAFVATWYTSGIIAAGVIGAVVGRFALRW